MVSQLCKLVLLWAVLGSAILAAAHFDTWRSLTAGDCLGIALVLWILSLG